MSGIPPRHRRRTLLINPRFQLGIALTFCLVVLACGGIFAGIASVRAKAALWDASVRGHYLFQSPYEIVRGILVGCILSIAGAAILMSLAVFWIVVRRIRRAMERVIRTLQDSAEGDLSTPTDAPGVRGIAVLGREIDMARAHTLSILRGIRDEVDVLRAAPIPEAEAAERWAALKDRMGRIAP